MVEHINIPVFYTGGSTTYSGLINFGGSITSTTVDVNYVPIVDTGYTPSQDFVPVVLPSLGIERTSAVYPVHPEEIVCTTSGCYDSLGAYYFSFGVSGYGLFQVFSDSEYVYAATTEGLEIYSATTNDKICTKNLDNKQANTVWGDGNTLYIGTTDGLYETSFVDICINTPYLSSRDLRSNYINYIHGTNNELFISTTSGIDYFDNNSSNPNIHSSCICDSVGKCFLTATSGYYFNTTSGIDSLDRIDTLLCDWLAPTYSYTTQSGIFNAVQLTDMFITEDTAENGGNTIFCTTTSGAYVIDEDSKNYAIYYTR